MTLTKEIITELNSIKVLLASNQTDYCMDSQEAMRIIGITNSRQLKELHDAGFLPRYDRGAGFVYKKSDCYKAANALDVKFITLKK
jgi:hypothetical protein